jgi:hypothetical protein
MSNVSQLIASILPLTGLDVLEVDAINRETSEIRFAGLDEWFQIGAHNIHRIEVGQVLAERKP